MKYISAAAAKRYIMYIWTPKNVNYTSCGVQKLTP